MELCRAKTLTKALHGSNLRPFLLHYFFINNGVLILQVEVWEMLESEYWQAKGPVGE